MADSATHTKAGNPRKQKPGAGRKPSSPMRQAQARTQPCRRTDPPPPAVAGGPLAGPPPPYLRAVGKTIWKILTGQQADAAAKNLPSAITEDQRPIAERYARACDHLAEIRKSQNRLRAIQPKGQEDMARWTVDDNGDVIGESPLWDAELKYQKEMTEAAKALGIVKSGPMFAFQQNLVAPEKPLDPALIGPHAEAAGAIVDAEVVQ